MSDYELKRINALPEASAINDSDVFAIDSAAGTKKVAWETLKGEVDADISEAVSNKADKDGTYPDMAVGSVLGTNTVTDREPYFLRPSASIGDREFDTLVGGSLGWNQLAKFTDTSLPPARSGITVTTSDNKSVTYNGTSTGYVAGGWYNLSEVTGLQGMNGHKALLTSKVISGTITGQALELRLGGKSINAGGSTVVQLVEDSSNQIRLTDVIQAGDVCTDYTITFNVIDLTTLFGSTIADYIYSLETATAGAGVAWVRKYLPNDYYAYCAPTLKHVSGVSAHVMRDANNNVIGNYPIDSTWVGMGIPKLDSDNKLYFDGDRYASDGTVTRRYGIVDLGTLNWSFRSSDGLFYSNAISDALGYADAIIMPNIKSALYEPINRNDLFTKDKTIAINSLQVICINNLSYTDAAAFKTAMSGVYLVYELATPTTSSASPFTSPQICDPDGAEEYVSTGLVPVGHETEYVENLADKLTDIPDLPTTEGTYSLEVTVSGGVPSYSWVSA